MTAAGRVVAWRDGRTLAIDLTPAGYAALGEPRVGDRLNIEGVPTTIRGRRMVDGNICVVVHGVSLATFEPSAGSEITARVATLERTEAGRLVLVVPDPTYSPGRNVYRGRLAGVYLGRPCTLEARGVTFSGNDARLDITAGDPLPPGAVVTVTAALQPDA